MEQQQQEEAAGGRNFVVRNFVVLIRINNIHEKKSFELFKYLIVEIKSFILTPKLSQKVNCIQSTHQDAFWATVWFQSPTSLSLCVHFTPWSFSKSYTCKQGMILFFCRSFKMELFLLLVLIYDGENLHQNRSFAIQFELVPGVISLSSCRKKRGVSVGDMILNFFF